MAINYTCDICNKPITAANRASDDPANKNLSKKLVVDGKSLHLQVVTGNEVSANPLDICKHCVLDALYELDDRLGKPQGNPNA